MAKKKNISHLLIKPFLKSLNPRIELKVGGAT